LHRHDARAAELVRAGARSSGTPIFFIHLIYVSFVHIGAAQIVELVHSEVGRVFALSSRGRNEFPDRSDSVRQAIGTARFFQVLP
jgi:transcriptional accessory protein Tex/SPT6